MVEGKILDFFLWKIPPGDPPPRPSPPERLQREIPENCFQNHPPTPPCDLENGREELQEERWLRDGQGGMNKWDEGKRKQEKGWEGWKEG